MRNCKQPTVIEHNRRANKFRTFAPPRSSSGHEAFVGSASRRCCREWSDGLVSRRDRNSSVSSIGGDVAEALRSRQMQMSLVLERRTAATKSLHKASTCLIVPVNRWLPKLGERIACATMTRPAAGSKGDTRRGSLACFSVRNNNNKIVRTRELLGLHERTLRSRVGCAK